METTVDKLWGYPVFLTALLGHNQVIVHNGILEEDGDLTVDAAVLSDAVATWEKGSKTIDDAEAVNTQYFTSVNANFPPIHTSPQQEIKHAVDGAGKFLAGMRPGDEVTIRREHNLVGHSMFTLVAKPGPHHPVGPLLVD